MQTNSAINTAYGLNTPSFDTLIKTNNLTPLHISVIRGDVQTMEKLLKDGADINALDKRRWTPLHHASVQTDTKMRDILYKYHPNPNVLNDTEATPMDLRRLVVQSEKINSSVIPLLHKNERGEISRLNRGIYKQITRSEYLLNHLVTLEYLIYEWKGAPKPGERLPFINEIKKKYLAFVETSRLESPHILDQVSEDEAGRKLHASPGLGVYTGRNFETEEVVGEYLGRVANDNPDSAYTLEGSIDGSQYSNEMTRVNDGFPNIVSVPIPNCRGMSKRNVYIASEPIKKGSELCWNYGFHSAKLGPYVELRPKALREFVANGKNLTSSLFNQLVFGLGISQNLNLKEYFVVEKFRYLLSTPAAMFNLILEGVVDDKKAAEIWKWAYLSFCIPESAPKIIQDLVTIAIDFRKACPKIQGSNPEKSNALIMDVKNELETKGIVSALEFAKTTFNGMSPIGSKPNAKTNITVINETRFNRKGIFGIGKVLTKQDIGSKFGRSAPFIRSEGSIDDWSYTFTDDEAMLLVDITDTHLVFKDRLLINPSKFSLDWNDGNWLTQREYDNFIKNNSLDDFPQTYCKEKKFDGLLFDDMPMRFSFDDFKSSNWEESICSRIMGTAQEDYNVEEWAKESREQLPKQPNDYRFEWPKQEAPDSPGVTDKEIKAKRTLGLRSDENNLSKIKKQFHQLALKYHPDKAKDTEIRKINEAKFKEISEAYSILLKAQENKEPASDFHATDDCQLEELFILSSQHYQKLVMGESSLDDEANLQLWELFYNKLEKFSFPEAEEELKHLFEQLVGKCREHCLSFKLNRKIKELEEGIDLSNAAKLEDLVIKMKSLADEFDLNNKRKQWVILFNNLFKLSNLKLLDKVVAFERTLVEAYLLKGDEKTAIAVRKRVLEFHKNQTKEMKEAEEKAKLEEFLFVLNSEKFKSEVKRERNNRNASMDLEVENKHKKENTKNDDAEDAAYEETLRKKPPRRSEIELALEHIAKNIQFFNAKPKKPSLSKPFSVLKFGHIDYKGFDGFVRRGMKRNDGTKSFEVDSKRHKEIDEDLKKIDEELKNKKELHDKWEKEKEGRIKTFRDLRYNFSSETIPDRELSPFFQAAKSGDCKKMELLLSQAKDLTERGIEDALSYASIHGQDKIIELMIKKGVNPNPKHKYDTFSDSYDSRLTPLGHAIEKRHANVVQVLMQNGFTINEVSNEGYLFEERPLQLFFTYHEWKGLKNPQLLKMLLSYGAKVDKLNFETQFRIGAYATAEELSMLIDAGLDPALIIQKEEKPHLKGIETVGYTSEVNLLDLAIIQAERANIFKEDLDSIEKVLLLIKKGANTKKCNNFCSQSYLHNVTHPKLIQVLCESGVDPSGHALAYKYDKKTTVTPIETAFRSDIIDILCKFGEDRSHAAFIKGSAVHQEALTRIGFDVKKGLDQLEAREKKLMLVKAAENHDISAFMALLGAGVDVNQRSSTGARWTCLHWLFSKWNHGSVSTFYDYMSLAESLEFRLISALIKMGAHPLKDDEGRTPLMCLNLSSFNNSFNNAVINLYIDYEARYYNLDPKEYKEKFYKLRDGGFKSDLFEPLRPIKSVFDTFWASFKNNAEFNPRESHNPVRDWNERVEFFKV